MNKETRQFIWGFFLVLVSTVGLLCGYHLFRIDLREDKSIILDLIVIFSQIWQLSTGLTYIRKSVD